MLSSEEKQRRRRWRRRLGLLGAAAMLLGLLAAPVWTPWLLRPVAARLGIAIGEVRRLGYWRLELKDVSFSQAGQTVHGDRVTLLQPAGWLVERWLPGHVATARNPAVTVAGWALTLSPPAEPPTATNSTAAVLDQTLAALARVAPWLHHARLEEGLVRFAANEVRIARATWADGTLTAEVSPAPAWGKVEVVAQIQPHQGFTATLRHAAGRLELALQRAGANGWLVDGTLKSLDADGQFQAAFGIRGWLPETATLNARLPNWPASLIDQPRGLSHFSATLEAGWTNGLASIESGFTAELTLPGLTAQPVTGQFTAEADATSVRLQRGAIQTPALTLALETLVAFPFSTAPHLPAFGLRLDANLAALGRPELRGKLTGSLRALPATNGPPRLTFDLRGHEVAAFDQPLPRCSLTGGLNWPELRLDSLQLGDDAGVFEATGYMDLARLAIIELKWTLNGLPRAFGQAGTIEAVQATGDIRGPLRQPMHSGRLAIGAIRLPGLKPLALALDWSGQAATITNWHARVTTQAGKLFLAGTAAATTDGPPSVRVDVTELTLREEGAARLELSRPTALRAEFTDAGPHITLAEMRLNGVGRELNLAADVTWPRRGRLRLGGRGLRWEDFRDWLAAPPPPLELNSLDLTAGWTNGPVGFDLQTQATFTPAAGPALTAGIHLRGDGDGVSIEQAEVRLADVEVGRADGVLPVTLDFTAPAARWLEIHEDRRLQVEATLNPNGPLWAELTRRLGLVAEAPDLRLSLAGTGGAPRGRLAFTAARIVSTNRIHGVQPPALEQPKVRLDLDAHGLLTLAAETTVLGQRGEATASLPVDPSKPATWAQPDWDQLSARLRLPQWDGAALAALAPDFLSPRGQLDLDLSLAPGKRLAGRVELAGLATRAAPPLGVLRDIEATVRLGNDGLRLERGRAELGGQPITAAGWWHFGKQDAPGFRFTLGGTNLALVRRPDVFLRGDLDLVIAGTNVTSGQVSGQVTLRNSLLMLDLRSLVTGSVEEPEARPPFFSVPTAPFGDWTLDLRVTGDRFLRVLTPVFKGRVSAALQLIGTLREPMVLGDVTVPTGRIAFPFGALQIAQGRVSLSRSQPFRPRLNFQASALNFGYDVRMEVSGAADAPLVVFSSVPPLTSTQILLMLTSGDIPSGTFSYSSRGRLQNIGLFLGKEFLGKLTGDSDNDRLSMRSGEEVTDRGQLTYTIEYQLSPRWSAFGTKDRFDSYAAGLKWRVFSK